MSKKNKIIIIISVIVIIVSVYFFKNYFLIEKNTIVDNSDFDFEIKEVLDVNKFKKYNVPIIIQFESESCAACKRMQPILKNLNEKLKGKVIIKYVDIWKHPGYAKGYDFKYIPAQIFIDADGNSFKPSDKLNNIDFEFKKNDLGYDYTLHTGILYENEILDILREMGYND